MNPNRDTVRTWMRDMADADDLRFKPWQMDMPSPELLRQRVSDALDSTGRWKVDCDRLPSISLTREPDGAIRATTSSLVFSFTGTFESIDSALAGGILFVRLITEAVEAGALTGAVWSE